MLQQSLLWNVTPSWNRLEKKTLLICLNTYIIDMRVSTRVDKLTIIEVPGNKKNLD